ncbi:MAG TPA: imidazole glycerol phosphate synthase subunit HisH [Steroidobacteraceae bacterium]|nr:imidazole glycerol phosphate synthase subunit HisH [Steroidobacteraceae bacterium]
MAQVSIVDYGIGNTGSIRNMLGRLRVESELVSEAHGIAAARRLILPGIGAFDACMSALRRTHLDAPVLEFARTGRPLLGICVGMQMLTLDSEEGSLPGLGLIAAHTRRFPDVEGLRIPHMGWNRIVWRDVNHPLACGLTDEPRFYFVHSYRVLCDTPQSMLACCSYGGDFAAAVIHENIAGVQFHPEKSHRFGLRLLGNFAGS